VVAFIAPQVKNEGTISANGGAVALAAGEKVTLNLEGNRFLGLTVERGALEALAENKGAIKADGGQVLLTAKAADALVKSVVNNEGTIEAQTLANVGGRIVLLAEGGETRVAGRLDASAPAGGDGGFVETSGDKVTIAPGATITTAAPQGSTGTWLVDPTDFTIAASGGDITGATLGTQLASNNVTLATAAAGAGNGDIFVNDGVTWANANTLTLSAHRNVDFSGGGTLNGGTTGNVTLNAGLNGTSGAIVGHATNTVVSGNTLVANARSGIGSSATPLLTQVANAALSNTQGGGIYVTNSGNLTVAAASTNGDINIRTTNGANVTSGAANRGGSITVGVVGGITGLSTTGSGNINFLAGNGGGTDGSGNLGGDGGAVHVNSALTSAGTATLIGGAGGYAGPGASFGGFGGAININAALNAAGVTLQGGEGGRGTGLDNPGGTSFGRAGGDISINASVNSTQAASLTSGKGGDGANLIGSGVGHGGNGGAITVNANVSAALNLNLATGDGGRGRSFMGNGGNGGATTLNAALSSGQSVALRSGHGAGFLAVVAGLGGSGGGVSSTASGTINAASDIDIAAGNGSNGGGCFVASGCAPRTAGGNGGAGGSIALAGALTSAAQVTLSGGIAGDAGTGSESNAANLAGGSGGAGGVGGSVTVGAIAAQGNVTVRAGFAGEGGAGGRALAAGSPGDWAGGTGGTGGAGGSVTINGALTGRSVLLRAGIGGVGEAGGVADTGPGISTGGVGGRGGDGGSIALNAVVTAINTATLEAGTGGRGAQGGAATGDTGVGGNGSFGGLGGAISVHAALTAGGDTILTAGRGGNGGAGAIGSGTTTAIGGNGGGGADGGAIMLNAPVVAGAALTLATGAFGNGGAGGAATGSGTHVAGNAGAAGAAGIWGGNSLNLQAGGALSMNATLPIVTSAARLVAGNGLGTAANPLVANAPSLSIANTLGGEVHVANTGGSINVEANTAAASIRLHAAGGLSLNGSLSATGAGDAIRLSGTNLVNNAGAAALSTPNGRWIVWSNSPVTNTFGGLQSGNAAVWSSAYPGGPGATLAAAGNRYAFSIAQPAGQAIVKADDKSKTYGDLFTGFTYTAFDASSGNSYGNAFTDAGGTPTLVGSPVVASTGAAATATRTGGNAGGESYDITVDLTGVTAAGYTLQGVNGLLTVNARNVSVAADAKNLTYGDAPQALTFTAANLASFDNNASAFTGAISRPTGANSGAGFERAGTTAITQGSLAANANYALTGFTGANYTIAPRALAVTATAQDKVYDGGTAATATLGDNRLAGDVFTASGSAAFADKTAATGKTVTVAGIGLAGADAGNYAPNASTTANATITQRALNIGFTGVDKIYDASAVASVTAADDRIAGDVLAINRSAAFADANAMPAKLVTVSGVSLAGTDAANYSLGTFNTATSANIAQRPLTITALDAAKLTTDPMPSLNASLAGFAPGEGPSSLSGLLMLTTPATASSPVGSYAIVPSGLSGANYTIAYVNGKLTVVSPNDPQLQGALSSIFAGLGGTGASGAPAVSGTGGTFILGGGMISIVTGDSGDE